MRIAIFSDTYAPEVNGVARTLKQYTNYLSEQKIEFKLFVPDSCAKIAAVQQVQRFTSIPFLLYTKEKLLTEKSPQNIEIWGRGVNHRFFSPFKTTSKIREKFGIKEKYILLYVGRIAPEKDIKIVLETFILLPEQLQIDTHLLIVGDGPLFEKLSEQTHDQIT